MAEVIPFKGLLYNPQKVDVSSVMAPPYDIVTPEFKDELYRKSPYNIIRVDFGKDTKGDNERENRYTRASKWLNEWLEQEILIQDSVPSFYCYEIRYHEKRLRGVIGAVKIEKLGEGKIRPHEVTYSKPKADRLNIIRICKANISPIFSLYSGSERHTSSILERTAEKKAVIEAKNGDGFVHRLWKIQDNASIETIREELSDKDIFIADGHHRYETALEFKNEMEIKGLLKTGTEPFNYVLMFLANTEDNGLTLLPTHRMIRVNKEVDIKQRLSPYFDITALNFNSPDAAGWHKMLKAMQSNRDSLGMFLKGEKRFYILNFKGPFSELDSHKSLRKLGVTILHKLIFEKLLRVDDFEYEMATETVIEKVEKGRFHAAFFLSPTRIEDVREVALAGQRMPPKSTYFYPKLLTGMVIYKF